MPLETQVTRVAQGTKDTLKALINMLGGTITDELIDQYPAIAAALLPPTGLTGNTVTVTAKEAIDAGNMIAIFTNDKTYDAYKATNEALPQTNFYLGVAKEAIESGATAQVISIAYLDNSASYVLEQNKQKQQKFWVGTKAEYDAVSEKDPETLYVITDESGAAQGYVTKEEYQALIASVDGKAPKSHAAQHAADGADPITIATSQVTGLDAALANKAEKSKVVPSSNGYIGDQIADLDKTTNPGHYLWIDPAGNFGLPGGLYDLYVSNQNYDVHESITQKLTRIYCGVFNSVIFERASYYANANKWTPWQQLATTSQLCNPNLLDNWYFVGGGGPGQFPIGQRGQTEYTGNGYCIDRWLFSGTVTLEADGILIKQSSTEFFMQKLPNEILNAIRGKVITISFAYIDGGLKIATSTFTVAPYGDIDSPEIAVGNVFFDLYKYGEDVARIRFFSVNTGNSIKLAAVKLELGSHQTLAHKEGDTWVLNESPNYGEQLARCQRYFYRLLGNNGPMAIGNANAGVYCGIIFPVPMRIKPAIVVKSAQLYLCKNESNNLATLGQIFGDAVANVPGMMIELKFANPEQVNFSPGDMCTLQSGSVIDFSADL